MRWDTTGLMWDDYVPPRVAKVKIKREPPEPTWLRPDYLPNIEEARAHVFDEMTDAEIVAAKGDRFTWDGEFYPNYVLFGFKHLKSGKVVVFEAKRGDEHKLPLAKIRWLVSNITSIGFNDNEFDVPMLAAILAGYTTDKLMTCVNDLIVGRPHLGMPPMRSYQFYRTHKLKAPPINNIDLLELTPLGPSLKICAGRISAKRMADLPFIPGSELTDDQIAVLRYYWVNDLDNTAALYEKHKTAIELREILTEEYGVDVRSKSDPQVAEAIIRAEITKMTGRQRFERAEIVGGRRFLYTPPDYIRYETPEMQWVHSFIKRQYFTVADDGGVLQTEALSNLVVPLGYGNYSMGVGGLHSTEKSCIHLSDDEYEISDNDVTSYYPSLIIQQGMYPPNIGPAFLAVFKRIYDRRINAKSIATRLKKEGMTSTSEYKRAAADAETLKIVLNGTFGKTGERGGYSVVYYPEMMVQVTLSGQLALLMLIERLELAGITVISANTDGIVVKCSRSKLDLKATIMKQWEQDTGLGLESVIYKAIYSRDVNNYVALYEAPKNPKTGFDYAKTIGAYRNVLGAYPLKWNPVCEIAKEAAILYLAKGTPVEETIRTCADMTRFIEVRRVTGGAWKDGEYLGKAIRWYYSTADKEPIINAKNGNTVPRSTGGRPCMTLPEKIPEDLDFDYYIARAYGVLDELGTGEQKKAA